MRRATPSGRGRWKVESGGGPGDRVDPAPPGPAPRPAQPGEICHSPLRPRQGQAGHGSGRQRQAAPNPLQWRAAGDARCGPDSANVSSRRFQTLRSRSPVDARAGVPRPSSSTRPGSWSFPCCPRRPLSPRRGGRGLLTRPGACLSAQGLPQAPGLSHPARLATGSPACPISIDGPVRSGLAGSKASEVRATAVWPCSACCLLARPQGSARGSAAGRRAAAYGQGRVPPRSPPSARRGCSPRRGSKSGPDPLNGHAYGEQSMRHPLAAFSLCHPCVPLNGSLTANDAPIRPAVDIGPRSVACRLISANLCILITDGWQTT